MKRVMFMLALVVSMFTVSCTKEVIKPVVSTETVGDTLMIPSPGMVCDMVISDTVTVVDTMLVNVNLTTGSNTLIVSHKPSAPNQYILIDFGNYAAMYQDSITVRIRRHMSNDIYSTYPLTSANGFTANINYSNWSPSKYIVEVVTPSGSVLNTGTLCKN